MELAAKLDDYGKPAWIALMVVGFIVFWPIGLGLLAYLLWSGRMGCGRNADLAAGTLIEDEPQRERGPVGAGCAGGTAQAAIAPLTNTGKTRLRRLEDEQREFTDFLERLRHARDKAEFDQFMDERARTAHDVDVSDAPEKPAPQA